MRKSEKPCPNFGVVTYDMSSKGIHLISSFSFEAAEAAPVGESIIHLYRHAVCRVAIFDPEVTMQRGSK